MAFGFSHSKEWCETQSFGRGVLQHKSLSASLVSLAVCPAAIIPASPPGHIGCRSIQMYKWDEDSSLGGIWLFGRQYRQTGVGNFGAGFRSAT